MGKILGMILRYAKARDDDYDSQHIGKDSHLPYSDLEDIS